jgi:hypothetical protein
MPAALELTKLEICLENTLRTKHQIHILLSDTDYNTVKDLHKCFELAVEMEVRFNMLIDKFRDKS